MNIPEVSSPRRYFLPPPPRKDVLQWRSTSTVENCQSCRGNFQTRTRRIAWISTPSGIIFRMRHLITDTQTLRSNPGIFHRASGGEVGVGYRSGDASRRPSARTSRSERVISDPRLDALMRPFPNNCFPTHKNGVPTTYLQSAGVVACQFVQSFASVTAPCTPPYMCVNRWGGEGWY